MAHKDTQILLAIETSCDETGIALLEGSGGLKTPALKILSNRVASQIELHAPYGGVVPNIAKREHIKFLPILLTEALTEAGIENPSEDIDALAVTVGPGLEPALWAGITFAQELAQDWKLPVVAANHMEGHIAAILLSQEKNKKQSAKKTSVVFPAIALLVSGGHTELVLVKNWLEYEVIGETVDDAAGEAFDKVARMLELGYPGGPQISKLAANGNRYAYSLPRPMVNSHDYNFSFSGLKTAVLYLLRDLKKETASFTQSDIAASFEEAVVDVLLMKTMRALKEYGAHTLILGGGVAANTRLRARMEELAEKMGIAIHLPHPRITTDNGAMIGAAAYFHAATDDFTPWKKLVAHATLRL